MVLLCWVRLSSCKCYVINCCQASTCHVLGQLGVKGAGKHDLRVMSKTEKCMFFVEKSKHKFRIVIIHVNRRCYCSFVLGYLFLSF